MEADIEGFGMNILEYIFNSLGNRLFPISEAHYRPNRVDQKKPKMGYRKRGREDVWRH